MSYKLDELYSAIAETQRTIGNYQMSDVREYGSGCIFFHNKNLSNGVPLVGKCLVVYATPAWEQFEDNDYVFVIDKTIEVNISIQLEYYDDFSDTYNIDLLLTGNLELDIEAYYEAMCKAFSIYNID